SLRIAAMATSLAAGAVLIFSGFLLRSAERVERSLATGERARRRRAVRRRPGSLDLVIAGVALLVLGLLLRAA
ncbi:MAG: hypothetical protein ACXVY3_10545, partial [Gaiellaceae bacterium]